jgi:hypothetical protein
MSPVLANRNLKEVSGSVGTNILLGEARLYSFTVFKLELAIRVGTGTSGRRLRFRMAFDATLFGSIKVQFTIHDSDPLSGEGF